ncbi:hypothetical protein F379_049 [Campylobacter phage F379]|uniref:Uncharacterized protein n=1 Tax=Campylobacter phage F379 TaxID=2776767 RepID=A0A7L8ZJU9_9CAUD|nr:hypothetical protein [Campylobacter jejuni]QOI69335.1 hypothetical protein F379_049 [Campylobacter phage F379]RTH89306.1 hypothetical protein C3I33_09290 [Campylobacter jejuni]RTH91808.1 hypothetical protein C3I35_08915 [Campylobacter jejuni]RTI53731.1 hypothetical protein C3I22_09135 [Campylobacter jejuni]
MIIEIKDFPLNVKRVVLEFDDSGACTIEPETKVKKSKISKPIKEVENDSADMTETEPVLDINFGSKPVKASNTEPIDKVVIPDIEREANVSATMQNLKL